MAGIDRERREDRVDLVEETLAERGVVVRDGAVAEDLDAFARERLLQVLEDDRLGRPRAPGSARGPRRAVAAGVASSAKLVTRPARTCSRRPEMRTWKNSSRFEAKIERNWTRSRRGFRSSRASSRTRALNSIQESSRFSCRLRAPFRPRGRGAASADRAAVALSRRRAGSAVMAIHDCGHRHARLVQAARESTKRV